MYYLFKHFCDVKYILLYICIYILLSFSITMSKRVTRSLKIDPEIWKAIKVYVAQHDTDISSFIESLAGRELKKK